MDIFLFTFGAGIVAIGFYDFLHTTISFSGLGFVSNRLTYFLWRYACRFARWAEERVGLRIRGAIGPVILVGIATFWILIHLLGYTLMFSAWAPLEESQSGNSATLIQTMAFAGSALSTLGASTVEVTSGWADILSMLAAVNGMVVLTPPSASS